MMRSTSRCLFLYLKACNYEMTSEFKLLKSLKITLISIKRALQVIKISVN
jgi:hypothetical protein